MRKKKILLTGTLLFMSWGTIQLYLFVHKPQYQIFRSVSGEEKKEFLWAYLVNLPLSNKYSVFSCLFFNANTA